MAAGPDFFDGIYARADGDETAIPWQHHAASRPLFDAWCQGLEEARGRTALVVASGLGDDAVALAAKGFDVTAFDGSTTAVDWARGRHSEAAVDWHVADLFATPPEWTGAFDLVVEVFTVQSIAPDLEVAAAEAIRAFVAPGGSLVAIAITGDPGTGGPPWPLSGVVIDALIGDLTVADHHVEALSDEIDVVRLELHRPAR